MPHTLEFKLILTGFAFSKSCFLLKCYDFCDLCLLDGELFLETPALPDVVLPLLDNDELFRLLDPAPREDFLRTNVAVPGFDLES